MSDKRPLYDNGVERHDVHTPEVVHEVYRAFGQPGSGLIQLDKYSQREFVHYLRALDKEHMETIALGLDAERKLRDAQQAIDELSAQRDARNTAIPMKLLDVWCPLLQRTRVHSDAEGKIDDTLALSSAMIALQSAVHENRLGYTPGRNASIQDAVVALLDVLVATPPNSESNADTSSETQPA